MLPLHHFRAFATVWLCGGGILTAQEKSPLREPVHPRRNVEEFPAVEAKFLRFTILQTSGFQPCLDELEVYGPEAPERNLALAENGTRARASGTLQGYRIHALPHLNDGLYGNGHSWISDTTGAGWVELEFPGPARISRVVWSRDRERKFIDRLPTEYRVEIAQIPGHWQTAASSAGRAPASVQPDGTPPDFSPFRRFSASATDLPGNDRPSAHEYLLQTWQTTQGLPANTVTALLQTRDGWLWIGTTNGLARFDGTRFTAFGESDGLPGLSITSLLEDSAGTLWAGTADGGLARRENGVFQAVRISESLADNTVLALAADTGGRLWAGTASGLHLYREGRFLRCADGPVSRIAADAEGGVWFIHAGNEMMRWDGQKTVKAPSNLDPSRFSSVSALASGPDGAVWFGGANGYVGRLGNGEVKTFGEGHTVLTSNTWELLPAENGDVWVGTSASGLARLRGGALLHLTTDDGLPSNSVTAICRDSEGNLWTGTAGGGLTRLRPRLVRALTTRDGLSHNGIMAMAEDAAGAVWIGTNGGGLNRWQDGKVEPFAPSYVLENRIISSLSATRDGALWVGTSGSGVFRIAAGKVTHFGPAEGLPGGIVTAMCEDAAGGLWLGTLDGGAACFSVGKFTKPPGLEALAGQPVTAILQDRAGRLWFGTAGQGVARLENGKLIRWTRGDGLVSGFIRTLREDSTGAVWAGTSGGLVRWTQDTPFNFTLRHGLPDAVISQILDDRAGCLWLGTNHGILRVSLSSLEAVATGRASSLDVLNLNTGDGLPSLECTGGFHPAGLRLRDGRLCFGTVAGLAVVNPGTFTVSPRNPPVIIESFSAGAGTELLAFPQSEILTIPFAAGRVDFRFTALCYTAPERMRLRYCMKGLDTDWVEADRTRTASYARLSPGGYRFEVQAGSGDVWNGELAFLALHIPAPWWRTPWALSLGAVTGIGAVAGTARAVTRRRLQRRLRAVEQQFALERERTRIARDIHDDLGANLTQISLLSAIGQERRHHPEVVEEQFAAIAATAGELVQAMDAIVWAVNPRHDTLESLARYLIRFSGDFFARSPVRLRLDVPPQLPDSALSSEVRHNLFLAAKEALNNVLSHAAATEVHLRIRAENGCFTLTVTDDGCGFSPASGSHGNGLDNMRQRLLDCGGVCEINSLPGQGTTVNFSIPLPSSP